MCQKHTFYKSKDGTTTYMHVLASHVT